MELFQIIAIAAGALFLTASIFFSRKIRGLIPSSLRAKWLMIDSFMIFFLLGYLFYLIVLLNKVNFPLEYVVSVVFFGGAVYVFVVINVSQQAIRQIKESQQLLSAMHKELTQAYESTVEGWGRALELRDQETEGHTRRVSKLTMELAEKFTLSSQEKWFLKLGVLLHDIGKMAIPDSVLLHTGTLGDAERTIMNKHPELAKEFLSGIDFLKPAVEIPYCHHERWDGTGYPRGLKGEEIPLGARIFAVADVWDALISERRYHQGWDTDKVCDHIVERSGTHFDPEVVNRFLELDLCSIHESILPKNTLAKPEE